MLLLDGNTIFKSNWTGKESDSKTNHSTIVGYILEGSFLDGLPSGKGKIYKTNKTKNDLEYDGGWLKGKRSGYGNYTSTAGHTYDGYQNVHLHVFIFDLKANYIKATGMKI